MPKYIIKVSELQTVQETENTALQDLHTTEFLSN